VRKLILLLLFIPLLSFGQEDIERFKVYDTDNIYTSLLLDTATGQIWQLQIGLGKAGKKDEVDQLKTVLSDTEYAESVEEITESHNESMKYWEETYNSKADSIVSVEDKELYKPYTLKYKLENWRLQQNGRFELYPTGNMYNFIMVDVIDGRSWQVQWSNEADSRLVIRFY
tara:strand:- start:46 stop:558 length:513 start_codon:yes stop_codon:yes gene_type:complete